MVGERAGVGVHQGRCNGHCLSLRARTEKGEEEDAWAEELSEWKRGSACAGV